MQWLAVAIGGALGAVIRYSLVQFFPHPNGDFPWSTFIANLTGSVLIGFCYVLIVDKLIIPSYWRPFVVVGILGGLTTFSTFALDAYLIWHSGSVKMSVFYLFSSVLTCLAAAIGSIYLAQRIF
ncbi:MAG: CrcB protein [Cellvibrionaceae bacterium]|jgi:CrcB protein